MENWNIDEDISKTETQGFLTTEDKKALIGKETTVVITELRRGDFKSGIVAVIMLNGNQKLWNLTHKNKNDLIDKFGTKGKDWIGKPFKITAVDFSKDTPTGHLQGTQINTL